MGNATLDCAADSAIDVPIPMLTTQTVAVAAMVVPRVNADRDRRSAAVSPPTTAETAANGDPAVTGAAAAAVDTPTGPTVAAARAAAPLPVRK
jgi:hypothetical protein